VLQRKYEVMKLFAFRGGLKSVSVYGHLTNVFATWFVQLNLVGCMVSFLHVTIGHLNHRNSFCLSVCLSVRLSHGCISQKWCKLGSPSLAAWKTLVSGSAKLFHKFKSGHPERGC